MNQTDPAFTRTLARLPAPLRIPRTARTVIESAERPPSVLRRGPPSRPRRGAVSRLRSAWLALTVLGLYALAPVALAQQNGPMTVITAPATEREFVDRIEALGTLQANELIDITALITERVTAIHFDDGDAVARGQILVEFSRGQEEALLAQARAVRDEAEDEFRRAETLEGRGAVSQSEFALRRRERAVAQARVAEMEARVSDRILRAPFDGIIGLRQISAGATVSPGEVIARLVDTQTLKLDFSVPASVLGALEPGAQIEARLRGGGDRPVQGSVASIDSVIDPVTRSVLVRAHVPNEDGRLRPGQLVRVDLLSNARTAIAVPEGALIPEGARTFVYVAEPGETGALAAIRREVRVGARRAGHVEILEGLESAETVIAEGALRLRPGALVRPVSSIQDSAPAPVAQPATEASR